MSFKFLDCTLRDGGYYTNWDFSRHTVTQYLTAFNDLPADYLEVGYRSMPMKSYLGEYFYCPTSVLQYLKSISEKKLAIILNEKDVRKENAEALLSPVLGLIDLVRIAVDPNNFKRALGLAEEVRKLGFKVSFNVMYMSEWNRFDEFKNLIPESSGLVHYFYMVDSFGGVYPEDVISTMDLLRSKTDAPIGFHGHNNLELALINTLTAIENGCDIVDATVTGMGRGAGNLRTELLLTVLNSKYDLEFDFNALSKVTDIFTELQQNYGWGTNLPYMVSGANSLPQKQVMEWVSKRFYSFNSIIRALRNESKGMKDNEQLPEMRFSNSSEREALIVGGGPSAKSHARAIGEFLKMRPEMLIIHASSKNAMAFADLPNDQIFCLVGNEGYRLERVFGDASKVKGVCILPPFPRKMGTYIPQALRDRAYELNNVYFTEKHKDSHSALAIQSVLDLKLSNLFIVGYDGYSGSNISEKEQDLFNENELLFGLALNKGLNFRSLTPTKYSRFIPDSVYAYL